MAIGHYDKSWSTRSGLSVVPLSSQAGTDFRASRWGRSRKRKIRMISDMPLVSKRFPRAAKYNPDWVLASVSGAANPLWLIDWLVAAKGSPPRQSGLDL